ncbi:MAG: WecB/TagA/CpsF family glycosyltransferase [Synechococcales bacterium]|nr:WecB/TagA/CpsF family glycosyltransferase [Synechococcales bacterium]
MVNASVSVLPQPTAVPSPLLSQEEVRQLYRRFKRVHLIATARYLPKLSTNGLKTSAELVIHQELQSLRQMVSSTVPDMAVDRRSALQERSEVADSWQVAPQVAAKRDNKQVYCAFRQAVLTASANALREQQAASLRKAVSILHVEIHNFSMQEFLAELKQGVVFTPNVDHLMKLQQDEAFVRAYRQADYRVCDSQVLLYASRFLGVPIKDKISGSDLFPKFCEYHKNNPNIRIFLLGGADGVAHAAKERINDRIGREIIVAAHSPSFGFEKNEAECNALIQLINRSSANVLVVGVGAPKQEIWITNHRYRLPRIDIFLAVGAAIDFEAGNKPRSPQWMSRWGVEWLHRLLSEPQRLWKRYLVDDLPFLGLLIQQKIYLSLGILPTLAERAMSKTRINQPQ